MVLIPKYTELPGFHGNEAEAEQRRQEMTGYMCADSFLMTPMPALAEVCSTLICSISSIIHDGALRKWPGRGGPPQRPSQLTVAPVCFQPVSVILKAPSAASVMQWGGSVLVKPTWSVSAVTSAPQGALASEPAAALVSCGRGRDGLDFTPLRG